MPFSRCATKDRAARGLANRPFRFPPSVLDFSGHFQFYCPCFSRARQADPYTLSCGLSVRLGWLLISPRAKIYCQEVFSFSFTPVI